MYFVILLKDGNRKIYGWYNLNEFQSNYPYKYSKVGYIIYIYREMKINT